MGLLVRTNDGLERRATFRDPDEWFLESLTGESRSASGERVNNVTALGIAAYFAAIRAISEDVAKLPFKVYRRLDRGKEIVSDHPVRTLLNDGVNEFMGSMQFRETILHHALAWGNGYAWIDRDRAGRPIDLILIPPKRVTPIADVETRPPRLFYRITGVRGAMKLVPASEIFHLHGLGDDGVVGYSIARVARDSLGLSLAAQRFGAAFFGNGTAFSGFIKHPGRLAEKARRELKQSIKQVYSGSRNAFKLFLLDEGMDYTRIGIPPEDAQFLETRQFQVREVARWFRIPPHKIADLDRATFSNIEEESISYVRDTLLSWMVRWEQEVHRKLFTPQERRAGIFAEHVAEGLLRGQMEARFKGYAIGRQWGWYSANDVLELENRNPLPADQGDVYLIPANMLPADRVSETDANDPDVPSDARQAPSDTDSSVGDSGRRAVDPATEPVLVDAVRSAVRECDKIDPHRIVRAYIPLYHDVLRRIMLVEADKVARGSKRSDFEAWRRRFYAAHKKHVADAVRSVADSYCRTIWSICFPATIPDGELSGIVDGFSANVAELHVEQSLHRIQEAEGQRVGMTEFCERLRREAAAERSASDMKTLGLMVKGWIDGHE